MIKFLALSIIISFAINSSFSIPLKYQALNYPYKRGKLFFSKKLQFGI
jgi:hypothetical protein